MAGVRGVACAASTGRRGDLADRRVRQRRRTSRGCRRGLQHRAAGRLRAVVCARAGGHATRGRVRFHQPGYEAGVGRRLRTRHRRALAGGGAPRLRHRLGQRGGGDSAASDAGLWRGTRPDAGTHRGDGATHGFFRAAAGRQRKASAGARGRPGARSARGGGRACHGWQGVCAAGGRDARLSRHGGAYAGGAGSACKTLGGADAGVQDRVVAGPQGRHDARPDR